MKMFSEAEARALLEKVVKISVADEVNAQLGGSNAGNIRFALNNVSTSGIVSSTAPRLRACPQSFAAASSRLKRTHSGASRR